MCGIWALVESSAPTADQRQEFLAIAGRGPDLTVLEQVHRGVWFGFHRLAIVKVHEPGSDQPIWHGERVVICNGEIYNHEKLKEQSMLRESDLSNGLSDCAAILHAMSSTSGDLRNTCALLDGVFSFVMADSHCLYVGRDPIGVRPLFYGFSATGALMFGSEAKSLTRSCPSVDFFPPGCCAVIPHKTKLNRSIDIMQYYTLPAHVERPFFDIEMAVQKTLIASVEKRLMGDRHFGVMLSGGLDSSLIAAIATRLLNEKPVAFSVGFIDSPDLANAAIIAKHLDLRHDIVIITPDQCLEAIPGVCIICVNGLYLEVVFALETFEPLIVRCGVAHYLLCKHIAAATDAKVLLSGEGADELFGSYAYMQRAPGPSQLHREIVRRMKHLHQYDVLRCDRATSCHGLEIRVPFLDKSFIDLVLRLPAYYKLIPNKMEKVLLRSSFAGWLPDEVLWRSKEGFSEALGKVDLGDVVQAHADQIITDEQFEARSRHFPSRTPETKEEMWYRVLFEECFGYKQLGPAIDTKVYRTAEWQTWDEKENCKHQLDVKQAPMRLRRRSTGSSQLSGVA